MHFSPIHQDGITLGDLTAVRTATNGLLHFETKSLRIKRFTHYQHSSVGQQHRQGR